MTVLGTVIGFYILEIIINHFVGHSHTHSHGGEHDDDDEHEKHQLPVSVAWLNLAAEVVHNFLDGIAIGVAFSANNNIGLSTTIAVGAHELPQELADFVVCCCCCYADECIYHLANTHA